MAANDLRKVLQEKIGALDPKAEWVGDCVLAPQLGVQLAIESYPGIRNVTLASVGPEQDLDGWRKIETELRTALVGSKQPPNTQGLSYVFLSSLLTAGVIYSLLKGRQELAEAFREMMRM